MVLRPELRVSVDVGCHRHSVVVGVTNGKLLEAFGIDHRPEGFADFFTRIERHQRPLPAREARSRRRVVRGRRRRRRSRSWRRLILSVRGVAKSRTGPGTAVERGGRAVGDIYISTTGPGRWVSRGFVLPGVAVDCSSELAGEIGTLDRFAGEASLALYLGMADLDHRSGQHQGAKAPRHVTAAPGRP